MKSEWSHAKCIRQFVPIAVKTQIGRFTAVTVGLKEDREDSKDHTEDIKQSSS
ncbi:MAG: hypothetical protein QXH91_08560 [Candidatus Bathyarchaeia archaeon]